MVAVREDYKQMQWAVAFLRPKHTSMVFTSRVSCQICICRSWFAFRLLQDAVHTGDLADTAIPPMLRRTAFCHQFLLSAGIS